MTHHALGHLSLLPPTMHDTPVLASLLSDSRFGDLARQFLDSSSPTTQSSHSSSAHPLDCPSCSTASLAFSLHSPRPPVSRGLALPPGSVTDSSRLTPVRRSRARKAK